MNTLIQRLRWILTDPHTSYQQSCFDALQALADYELEDPTAPHTDYIGDRVLPFVDDMAELIGDDQC